LLRPWRPFEPSNYRWRAERVPHILLPDHPNVLHRRTPQPAPGRRAQHSQVFLAGAGRPLLPSMIDYSVFSQSAAARGSIISGPVSRSATAFNFCIQGQIRLRRHLVIGSQVQVGGLFRVATPLVADRRNAAVRLLPYAIRPPARGGNLSSSATTELPSFRRVTMAGAES